MRTSSVRFPFNKKRRKKRRKNIPVLILSIGTLISAFAGSHHRLSEQKRRRIRSIRIPFSVERSVLKKKGEKGNEEKEEREKGPNTPELQSDNE